MGLKINKLIEVAENVIYDEQMGFAALITKHVQVVTDERENKYVLSVQIVRIENEEEQDFTERVTN